jgi:hypothetical protein
MVQKTTFGRVMGDLSLGKYSFTKQVSEWLPAVLILFLALNYFEVYGKLMGYIGAKQFQYSDSFSDEDIEKGKEIVKKRSFLILY